MHPRVPRGPPELDGLPVAQRAQRAERRAQVGVVGERADGAVHVEFRVAPGVAAVGDGERDQLVPVRVQGLRPGAEHLASLREAHLPQRGGAGARVLERRREVDPARPGAREGLLGGGVHQGREGPLSFDPASLHVAAQHGRHFCPPAARAAGAAGRGSTWGISASA